MIRNVPSLAALFVACVILPGCDSGPGDQPEVVPVSGTVILDGDPVEGASVSFIPVDDSRGSVATTDAEGRYELRYVKEVMGAIPGKHKVKISTRLEDQDTLEVIEDELIPSKYSNGEHEVTVPPEGGTIDFKIDSGS